MTKQFQGVSDVESVELQPVNLCMAAVKELNEESANKRIRKLRAGLLAQGAYKKKWPGRKWVLELENGASCFNTRCQL